MGNKGFGGGVREYDIVITPFQRIVRSRGVIKLHVIYINYMARVISGRLKPDSDVGEAIWVKRSEIHKIWSQLHQDTKKLLKLAGFV